MNRKGQKLPAEPLTPAESQALIAACSPNCPTGIRNRALIAILWRAGLRISEAVALYPKDIDDDGTLRILHGKGDKARTVAIDKEALDTIRRWMDERKRLGLTRAPLFCTLKGTAIKADYVRHLLPRLRKKAKIEKRCHPHGMRHSYACDLLDEGHDIRVIQSALGHERLETTAIYLDHLKPQRTIEALKARQWPMEEKPDN